MARPGVPCLPLGRPEDAEAADLVGYLESHEWVLSNTIEPTGKDEAGFVRFHCSRCGVDFGLFFSEGTRPQPRAPSTERDAR